MQSNAATAAANFSQLRQNPYPGRGIVVGLDQVGLNLVQVYWIMGRSENSRNRVFKNDDTGRLYTEAADPAKMKDSSLVIYNAMRERGSHYIVSNGDQTDTVADSPWPLDFGDVLRSRTYEPDAPNFTQRITAISSLAICRTPLIRMSIIRKSLFGDVTDRLLYELWPYEGYGYCVTTYAGDGDPLPAFRGDPLVMPLDGDIRRIAEEYWDALNEVNRVSLAVKFVDLLNGRSRIHIINRY